MSARSHRRLVIAACSVALALLVSCGGDDAADAPGDRDELRISSFDFAESELLSELYAQAAEGAGIPVVRLGPVGPREIVAPALISGEIDLVPEYAGTALTFHDDTASDLNEALLPKGLTALAAAPARDTNVFVVTTAVAETLDLVDVSDLAGAELPRFGGPAECAERPLCLAGLRDVYGITFDEFVVHPSLTFTSEALRRDEVDVGLLFSTAPELDAADLTALVDDRELQPAENVVPVVRIDALDAWPELQPALDRLSSALTTGGLRTMNRRVAAGEPIATVAADWLQAALKSAP